MLTAQIGRSQNETHEILIKNTVTYCFVQLNLLSSFRKLIVKLNINFYIHETVAVIR